MFYVNLGTAPPDSKCCSRGVVHVAGNDQQTSQKEERHLFLLKTPIAASGKQIKAFAVLFTPMSDLFNACRRTVKQSPLAA